MIDEFSPSDLHMICERIISIYTPDILQNPNWGNAANFNEIRPPLDALCFCSKQIMTLNTEIIPTPIQDNIYNQLLSIAKLIDSIREFTITEDFQSRSNNILSEFSHTYQKLSPQLATWLPFLISKNDIEGKIFTNLEKQIEIIREKSIKLEETLSLNIDKIETTNDHFSNKIKDAEEQIQSVLHLKSEILTRTETECEKIKDTTLRDFEKKSEDAQKILSNVKATSALKAITPYSTHFHRLSTSKLNNSYAWLFCAILALIASLSWAVYCLQTPPPETNNTYSLIYFSSSRIFVAGIIVSGLIWCARQYRIERHQHTVASHKANALDSFEAFVGASNDPKIRDAVLVQTAQSIFNAEQTGYLGKDADIPSANHLELLKLLSK